VAWLAAWLMWWPGNALASDGFDPVRSTNGCTFEMRPETHPERAAMRARCHWPEIDPAAMGREMQRVERYTEYVYPIEVSEVRRDDGARWLVYQRQHVWPIADREVLLWMGPEPVDGGVKVAWTAAHEEPLALQKGAIRVPRNDGFWEITVHADGGAAVVHQIAMDGGGRIPRWLVDLVRTRGFVQVMGDVRELMGASAPR